MSMTPAQWKRADDLSFKAARLTQKLYNLNVDLYALTTVIAPSIGADDARLRRLDRLREDIGYYHFVGDQAESHRPSGDFPK